jgi:predicted Zn-dependent protease
VLDRIVASEPDKVFAPAVVDLRVGALVEGGSVDEAIQALEGLPDEIRDEPRFLIPRLGLLFSLGRFGEAVAILPALDQDPPADAPALSWFAAGLAAMFADEPAIALERLRRARPAFERNPMFEMLYGSVLVTSDAPDEAAEIADSLVASEDGDVRINGWALRGRIAERGADESGIIESYREVVNLAEAIDATAGTLSRTEQQARRYQQSMLAVTAELQIAHAEARRQNWDAAGKAFRAGVRRHDKEGLETPIRAVLLLGEALVSEAQGDYEGVLAATEDLI